MAGSVNQNFRFDLGARKMFFVPTPKIVLQQYRPSASVRCAAAIFPESDVDGVTGRTPAIAQADGKWSSLRMMVSKQRSLAAASSKHHQGTTMNYYAGIDVSLEESSVCPIDATGKIVREAKVASEPEALIAWFCSLGVELTRIGLEAGPLSQWLYAGMQQAGLAVELLETQHVRNAFKIMPVKTDRKDARGIAELIRLGWFRPVHCKSMEAQETRAMLTARKLVQKELLETESSLRGILRGFGLKVGKTTPIHFEGRIKELVAGHPSLEIVASALLSVRATLRRELDGFEKRRWPAPTRGHGC